jgi:hypothetical protein
MIPSDPNTLKKLKELAARNIANGDWGNEITFPGEEIPLSPEERESKNTVSDILSKSGPRRLPKKK